MDAPNRNFHTGAQRGNGSDQDMWTQQQQMQRGGDAGASPQMFNYATNIYNFNFMNAGQYNLNIAGRNGFPGSNAQPPVAPTQYGVPVTPNSSAVLNVNPPFTMSVDLTSGFPAPVDVTNSSMYQNLSSGSAGSSRHVDQINTPNPSTYPMPSSSAIGRAPIRIGRCAAAPPPCPHMVNQYTGSTFGFPHGYRDVGPSFSSLSQGSDDVFEEDQELLGSGGQSSVKANPFGHDSRFHGFQ